MKAGAIGAGVFLAAASLAACAAAKDAVPRVEASPPDPAQLALGRDGFAQCDGCHSLEPGGRSGMGPSLYGIAGRQAGGVAGYPYSDALARSGVTWEAGTLDAFLADPTGFIPGSEMQRGTVSDSEMRAAIVAYLLHASE